MELSLSGAKIWWNFCSRERKSVELSLSIRERPIRDLQPMYDAAAMAISTDVDTDAYV